MAGFTKGEWKHVEDGVIIATDGKQIASVFPRDREANARLMAASPRMYEALKLLMGKQEIEKGRVVCRSCPSEEAILLGAKALAKAIGKE